MMRRVRRIFVAAAAGGSAALVAILMLLTTARTRDGAPARPSPIAAPSADPSAREVPTEPVASTYVPASSSELSPPNRKSRPPGKKRPNAPADCSVPYTVDAEGRTIWRRECFKP